MYGKYYQIVFKVSRQHMKKLVLLLICLMLAFVSEAKDKVYLQEHLVKGVNKLTQDMLPARGANKIYVIQYDYLVDGTLIIPQNSELFFDGGSISGGILSCSTKVDLVNPSFVNCVLNFDTDFDDIFALFNDFQSTLDYAVKYKKNINLYNRTIKVKTKLFVDKPIGNNIDPYNTTISNGRIILTDGKFLFSSRITHDKFPVSQYINFENIAFSKENKKEGYIFEDNIFHRIKLVNCSVDGINLAYSDKYISSFMLIGCTIEHISGTFFTCKDAYGLNIVDNIIQSNFNATMFVVNGIANGCRFTNNTCENCGKFLKYYTAKGLSIENNYFENINEGIIEGTYSGHSQDYIARGVNISNNFCYISNKYLKDNYYYVVWPSVTGGVCMGNYDASAHGSSFLNSIYNDIFDRTADYALQVPHSGVDPKVYVNTEEGKVNQALKNARSIPIGTMLLDPWCETPVKICVKAGNYATAQFIPLNQGAKIENVTTKKRPTKGLYIGYMIFDTTLKLPLWWTGDKSAGKTGWVDATGNNR